MVTRRSKLSGRGLSKVGILGPDLSAWRFLLAKSGEMKSANMGFGQYLLVFCVLQSLLHDSRSDLKEGRIPSSTLFL